MTQPLTRECGRNCGRMIRRKGATVEEAPGTFPGHGRVCRPCHRTLVPEPRCTVEHNRRGAIHFLERSRQRKTAMLRRALLRRTDQRMTHYCTVEVQPARMYEDPSPAELCENEVLAEGLACNQHDDYEDDDWTRE